MSQCAVRLQQESTSSGVESPLRIDSFFLSSVEICRAPAWGLYLHVCLPYLRPCGAPYLHVYLPESSMFCLT